MKPTKQQFEATSKFHERAAQALASLGKTKGAESAKKAAELCRKNAKKA